MRNNQEVLLVSKTAPCHGMRADPFLLPSLPSFLLPSLPSYLAYSQVLHQLHIL